MDLTAIEEWLQHHEEVLTWLGIGTVVALIVAALLVPRLVAGLPADYFCHQKRKDGRQEPRSATRLVLTILKNTVGFLFVLAGVAMLVLPGPGTVTILLGLVLMDFPGKYKLVRSIVARPAVLGSLNKIRGKAGVAPLQMHEASSTSTAEG